MTEFVITAERSPDWDDAEVRRRLGRAYSLILSYEGQGRQRQNQDAADRGEFGDPARTAAEATAPHEAVG
jgi:hypothetical protein